MDTVAALLAVHGEVRSYASHTFGRETDDRCISVLVDEGTAMTVIQTVRAALPAGYICFLGTTRFRDKKSRLERLQGLVRKRVEVVVARGASLDAVRVARTDAVNYDLDTEAIVRKLAQWDASYGIDVIHAETDTIEFTLKTPPPDLPAFAQDVYAFCPDVVDQGCQTVERLAETIRSSNTVYLWWD